MRWHFNLPNGVPSASPQHQLMAEHYQDVIEQALREFDNSHDDGVYEALAWTGLRGSGPLDMSTGLPTGLTTVAWDKLPQQERIDLINTRLDFIDDNPNCQ